MSSIREKLDSLQLELGPGVTIVGVAKSQSIDKVREAICAGLKVVANNYFQEGEVLRQALIDEAVNWHFIGHIQSRKAKELIHYDCVQSLDRLSLAAAMNKALVTSQRTIEILVQVNIGEEPQKSGVLPEELPQFLNELSAFPQLKLKGLMALPPLTATAEARRPYFKMMRRLYDLHQKPYSLSVLSMGMSDDYRIAAEEGSTMVRLGTLLFGSRT